MVAGRREGVAGDGGEVSADIFDRGEGFFEGLFGGRVDGGYFLLDAEPVGGKVAGYVEELAGDDVSDSANDDEGEDAGDGDGEDAGDAAGFKAADGGGE